MDFSKTQWVCTKHSSMSPQVSSFTSQRPWKSKSWHANEANRGTAHNKLRGKYFKFKRYRLYVRKRTLVLAVIHLVSVKLILTFSSNFLSHRNLKSASKTLRAANTWCSWEERCWPTSWKTKSPSGSPEPSTRRKAWRCWTNWEERWDEIHFTLIWNRLSRYIIVI